MIHPMVTVVVPAYNQEDYIEETLQSILAQSFADYEVIVVDDGSEDGTGQVVSRIRDHRFHYVYQANSGRPACSRNRGVSLAKGEYVAFLDGDDLWVPDKLEKQLQLFQDHPEFGLVFSNAFNFDEKGKRDLIVGKTISSGYLHPELFRHNFIAGCTVMARKNCLDAAGGFNEGHDFIAVEDYDLWLRMSRRCPFGYIDEPLALYRLRAGSASGGNVTSVLRLIHHLNVLRERGDAPRWLYWKKYAALSYELAAMTLVNAWRRHAKKAFR